MELFFWSAADAIFPVKRVFVHLYLGEVTEWTTETIETGPMKLYVPDLNLPIKIAESLPL